MSKESNQADSAEKKLIQIIVNDDRDKLVTDSKSLFREVQLRTEQEEDEVEEESLLLDLEVDEEYIEISNTFALRLLRMCCTFDSVECAKALIDGEIGLGLQVNRMDESGRTALHYASEMHSRRVVELLLGRNARTDRRSKDDVASLPIEFALSSGRMVMWDMEQTIGNLLANLSEMDLSVVRMLAEKTRDIANVAYACAIEGGIVPLAALLMVVPEKVAAPITILRPDGALNAKETTTVFHCLVKEALTLGQKDSSTKVSKRFGLLSNDERRKLLLLEIELLQFFGAAVLQKSSAISPLICATQAGDEDVVKLLLSTDIDVNEIDADGNSALYWHIKKFSNATRLRILLLLIKHGASVRQRNKLGMTPFHIAAATGYFQALQILLLKDPNNVDATTQMKETPLFFAVKHDFVNCAQLLMRSGADTKIFNLRKQRPKDLAQSQDMCFLLNQKVGCWSSPIQSKESLSWLNDYQSDFEGDIFEVFLNPKTEAFSSKRLSSSARTEVCKYFDSIGWCARGSDCFYAHGEAELACGKFQKQTWRTSELVQESKLKVFVGGLPLTVDSGILRKFFEDQFGSVEHAKVVAWPAGDHVISRGFGFVTFKSKESFAAAVKLHFVNIWGKRVEIKEHALPEPDLLSEAPVAIPKVTQNDLLSDAPVTKPEDRQPNLLSVAPVATTKDTQQSQGAVDSNEGYAAERSNKPMSWLESLMHGQPRDQPRKKIDLTTKDQSVPSWLTSFKKWFPGFFTDVLKNLRKGEWYALSSVKADFKTHCGLKLDHVSAGYPKLSDFMRSLPDLCRVQYAPAKDCHAVCHLVLLPPKRYAYRQLTESHGSSDSPSDDGNNYDENYIRSTESLTESTANGSFTNDSSVEGTSSECSQDGKQIEVENRNVPDPDPRITTSENMHPMLGRQNGGGSSVLLALQAEKESFSYFTRHPTFFKEYREETLEKRKCFRCKGNKIACAARPCGHFLWCSECMLWANKHKAQSDKCVICDATVQRYILVPWPIVEQQCLYNHAFPDLSTANTTSRKKKLSPVGKPLNNHGYPREVLVQI